MEKTIKLETLPFHVRVDLALTDAAWAEEGYEVLSALDDWGLKLDDALEYENEDDVVDAPEPEAGSDFIGGGSTFRNAAGEEIVNRSEDTRDTKDLPLWEQVLRHALKAHDITSYLHHFIDNTVKVSVPASTERILVHGIINALGKAVESQELAGWEINHEPERIEPLFTDTDAYQTLQDVDDIPDETPEDWEIDEDDEAEDLKVKSILRQALDVTDRLEIEDVRAVLRKAITDGVLDGYFIKADQGLGHMFTWGGDYEMTVPRQFAGMPMDPVDNQLFKPHNVGDGDKDIPEEIDPTPVKLGLSGDVGPVGVPGPVAAPWYVRIDEYGNITKGDRSEIDAQPSANPDRTQVDSE